MMNYPKVAIIILNYNGWADTIECLESVLRNDYPNYQVIVVDNNSPNNSMEYIKAWAEGKLDVWVNSELPLRHLSFPPVNKPIPYVYYIRNEAERGGKPEFEESLEDRIPQGVTTKYPLVFIQTGSNLGYSGGNNIGIAYALKKRTDYLLILNNDTIIKSETVSTLIEVAERTKASVVGALIKDALTQRPVFISSRYPQMFFYSESQKRVPEMTWWPSDRVEGSAMLLDRKLLLERQQTVGYFLDESLFLYCEEMELIVWCRQNGKKSVVSGESIVYHKVGISSGGRGSPIQFYYQTRNRVLLARRYLRGPLKVCFFVFYPLWRMIRAGIYAAKGRSQIAKSILQGLLDGYKGRVGEKDISTTTT